MFYSLRGVLLHTGASTLVVECGGVAFLCNTSLNTLSQLNPIGSEVTVLTHLCVKEDAFDLFAFSSQLELDCFKLLITVKGVGPKAAISILSELTPERLALCIASGDLKALSSAQGIGKKTAERIVLELKDKLAKSIPSVASGDVFANISAVQSNEAAAQAIEALVALGFTQSDSARVVAEMDDNLTVDDMIRKGLNDLARQV